MTDSKYCPQCGNPLTSAEIAGRQRQVCSAGCGFVLWDNPVPVVAGIVEYDDSVVLVRNKGWPEKIFGLVTGFLERNESPENAILRELQEELGLVGEIAGFVGNYAFFHNNQVILAYHVHAKGEIRLGEELSAYKLVRPENLRPWPFGTGPALKDWLQRRKPVS